MAEELARLTVALDARIQQFEAKVQRAEQRLSRAARTMQRDAQRIDRSLSDVGADFGLNIPTRAGIAAAAIAGVGLAIRSVIRAGEQMKLLEGRFTALTGSAERGAAALERAFETSNRTGDSVQAVAELSQQFLLAADSVGASDQQVARFAENILKLGRLGGASAQAVADGSRQLAQGLNAGIVRAEEFNSILENMPLVAQRIAQGLDVSIGGLRQMVLDGRLLSDDVFRVILQQSADIDAQFAKLPVTTEQASTRMANALARVASEIDRSIGLSRAWAGALDGVAAAAERAADGFEAARQRSNPTTREAVEARLGSLDYSLQAALDEPTRRRIMAEQAALEADLARMNRAGPTSRGGRRGRSAAGAAPGPDTFALAAQYGAYRPGQGPNVDVTREVEDLAERGRSRGGGSTASKRDPFAELSAQLQRMTRDMDAAARSVGLTGTALAEMRARVEANNLIMEEGRDLTVEQREALKQLADGYVAAAVSVATLEEAQAQSAQAAADQQRLFETLAGAMSDAAVNATSLEDALRRVIGRLLEPALLGFLTGSGPLGGIGKGLFGEAAGGLVGALFGSPVTASANGNAFRGGRVIPFAKGGVVGSPTVFPMRGGTGLMGEAGPEAIMPLRRGPGGRLGVDASGASVVEVRLAPGLEGVILAEAEGRALRIVEASQTGPAFTARVVQATRTARNSGVR